MYKVVRPIPRRRTASPFRYTIVDLLLGLRNLDAGAHPRPSLVHATGFRLGGTLRLTLSGWS